MEKYSVLMSLYKKETPTFFRESLESVLNQTVKPDEIVLVEDGPLTKELYEIVDEYSEYLTVVKNEKNMGLGLALNVGLKACKNELVARMDTDDIAVKNRCEKQLLFFENNPDVTICGGQIEEFIDNIDNVVGKRVVPETDLELKKYLKKRCPFNHVTVMFRRTAVLDAGNYQDWFWNEDYYLWIRMAIKNQKFANVPETLVKVRVGKDMYARRGGKQYFKSEIGIQKLMLDKGLISKSIYYSNCVKRFVVQVMLPNKMRAWVFCRFARS